MGLRSMVHKWCTRYFFRPTNMDDLLRLEIEPENCYECEHPQRVTDPVTGEKHTARCGSRFRSKCEGCSRLYSMDSRELLMSGMELQASQFVALLTITAPSFGDIHRVVKKGRKPTRCKCGKKHDPVKDSNLRGIPLDFDNYDYEGQVRFNCYAGKLWDATRALLNKYFPDMAYTKVGEWQERGALHYHVLVRAKILKGEVGKSGKWTSGIKLTRRKIKKSVLRVTTKDMHGDELKWGRKVDCEFLNTSQDRSKAAYYLRKAVGYLLKDLGDDTAGGHEKQRREHLRRLNEVAEKFECPSCFERHQEIHRQISDLNEQLGQLDLSLPEDRDRHHSCMLRLEELGIELKKNCGRLLHRRCGARSSVMSFSRSSKPGKAWSAIGLTRKKLRERRENFAIEVSQKISEVCERVQDLARSASRLVSPIRVLDRWRL